jgi:hypothetical protein
MGDIETSVAAHAILAQLGAQLLTLKGFIQTTEKRRREWEDDMTKTMSKFSEYFDADGKLAVGSPPRTPKPHSTKVELTSDDCSIIRAGCAVVHLSLPLSVYVSLSQTLSL